MFAFRMNLRWLTAAGLLSAGFIVSIAPGAHPDKTDNRSTRAVEIARLRFKLYERVDYPLLVRQLKTEIKLMEARAASLRRRLKEAERFHRAKALWTTTENLRLDLFEAELLLKDWNHELVLLQNHNQDERRLRQLLIEEAARTPGQ